MDKLILQSDPVRQVVVTPSWIIKTGWYNLHIARQDDVQLEVRSADDHAVAVEARGAVQYLNILVTSGNPAVKAFTIRYTYSLNSRVLLLVPDVSASF